MQQRQLTHHFTQLSFIGCGELVIAFLRYVITFMKTWITAPTVILAAGTRHAYRPSHPVLISQPTKKIRGLARYAQLVHL